MNKQPERRRGGKQHAMKDLIGFATKHVRRKRGLGEQRLITEWPNIVGDALAQHSMPSKMIFDPHGRYGAKLHVMVEPSWAMEIQYMQEIIIEKIACFFGYKAVEELVLIQTPIPQPELSTAPAESDDVELDAELQQCIDSVEQDDVKNALSRLGKAIKKRRSS